MGERTAEIRAFIARHGWAQAAQTAIAGDASKRRYVRLTQADGRRAMLMDAPPHSGENVQPFVVIADHLRDIGLSAPEIFAKDLRQGLLLIEDFGDDVFAKLISGDRTTELNLYQRACDVLLILRSAPPLGLSPVDETWLLDMLDPLFEWYLPEADPQLISSFRSAFMPFASDAANYQKVTMLRDYHVENLMLLSERTGVRQVGILDFQDAMYAHPAYDLVSILQDARRDVDVAVETKMIDYYFANSSEDETAFRRDYAVLGVQRNLRIMGIFARLSRRDGKDRYVEMIPRVWEYVQRNLAHPDLATLRGVVRRLVPEPSEAHLNWLRE